MRTLFSILLLAGSLANAEDQEMVDLLLDHSDTEMELALNESTVRCLVGDYGASSLKISVPQLRDVTIFRHTTTGEVLPCINAGRCKIFPERSGKSPSDILDPSRPTEKVSVSVDRYERLYLNHKNKSCQRSILERVFTRVRGMDFRHEDSGFLGNTNYDVCLKLKEKKS